MASALRLLRRSGVLALAVLREALTPGTPLAGAVLTPLVGYALWWLWGMPFHWWMVPILSISGIGAWAIGRENDRMAGR